MRKTKMEQNPTLMRVTMTNYRVWVSTTRRASISNSLPKFTWQMLYFGKLLKKYAKLKRGSLQQFLIFNLLKQKKNKGPTRVVDRYDIFPSARI